MIVFNEKNDLKRAGSKTIGAYFEQVDLLGGEIANGTSISLFKIKEMSLY